MNTAFVLLGFLVSIPFVNIFHKHNEIVPYPSAPCTPKAVKIETQFYIFNLNVIQNMQIAIPSSQAIRRKAVRYSRVGPRICADAMEHGGKFLHLIYSGAKMVGSL